MSTHGYHTEVETRAVLQVFIYQFNGSDTVLSSSPCSVQCQRSNDVWSGKQAGERNATVCTVQRLTIRALHGKGLGPSSG